MNLREKSSYLDSVLDKILPNAKEELSNLTGVYVEGRYFRDDFNLGDDPIPLYFVVKKKPSGCNTLEELLNSESDYFLSIIVDVVEFYNNFKPSCTLVEKFL